MKELNLINLKIGDLVMLEERVYRVGWTKWNNGKEQGNRALLKLLSKEELMKIIIEGDK